MTVRELLDKQYDEIPILINERFNNINKLKKIQFQDDVYDEYGNREVDYFYHFLDNNDNIVICIQVKPAT